MKTLAVIDDDERWLDFVEQVLEDENLRMVRFTSPIGATTPLADAAPNLILVDLKMAGVPGDVFISGAKRTRRLADARFVICSNANYDELERVSRWAGADGFMRKTGDPAELLTRIQRWL
jgi:DNA-binding response OmpR family regulator